MASDRRYKIVVVEDEPMIIDNIIQKLANAGTDYIVAGSAQDGIEALSVIDTLKPDILFTDIRMPKLNGLELIRQVKSNYPGMQIVIISGYGNFDYAQQAIKLGVEDYLLKPISVESLRHTLDAIKTRLDRSTLEREKDFLLSCATGLSAKDNLPDDLGDCMFGVFILCVGHLLNHTPDKACADTFSRLWSKIVWNCILPANARWQIIEDKYPNQKCLIMAIDDPGISANTVSSRLLEELRSAMVPLPVTIASCQSFVHYTDVWDLQQRLRTFLEQHLVIGQSSIITSEVDRVALKQAILDATFQNKVSAFVSQKNAAVLHSELMAQLESWQASPHTQIWMETLLQQLLKLFQRLIPSVTEEEVMRAEYDLNEKLCLSVYLGEIFEDIWLHLERMLNSSERKNSSIKELIAKIEAYIQSNYCSDINIEEIARKFSFNSTYLTKVFKKEKGLTPVKFIMMLRIQEAERLLTDNPELDVRKIGEIVGYDDPQYFSRIFKNVANCTPTEYRETENKRVAK